jgi:hypothetical protein
MYDLVYDIEEMKKFHSFMHPLKPGEAYFVSMSARDKYLTKEERVEFSLGRPEMFGRKIVKGPTFDEFLRVVRSMEVNEGGYTTRNGLNIPKKCMIIYVNINASSGYKALKEFNGKINELMFETLHNVDTLKHFASLDSMLMNCFQRQAGTKYLIDADFDVPKNERGFELLQMFLCHLRGNRTTYKVIETHGGYHVLMVRDTLRFNYVAELNALDVIAKKEFGKAEIVRNVNDMVPLPGCYQGLFPVHFIDV